MRITSIYVRGALCFSGVLLCTGFVWGDEAPKHASERPDTSCRALINLMATPVDPEASASGGEVGMQPFVVDLRIAEESTIDIGPGLVVKDGEEIWSLDLEAHRRLDTGPEGTTMERSWSDLVATRLRDGEAEVWIDGEPELFFPTPESGHSYDEARFHSVVGIFGPYVSVETSSGGYLGGPRDSTWVKFSTLRAGQRTSLDFLGPEARAAMVAAVAEESENRRSSFGDSWEGLVPPEDLSETAFSLNDEGRLQLSTILFCCSWAENHNTLYVHAPLPEVPAPLEPFLSFSETSEALIEAPNGCGAVGLNPAQAGLAVLREGMAEPEELSLPGLQPATLLGVYWIAGQDPFRTEVLN